jgi:hypothetical protein
MMSQQDLETPITKKKIDKGAARVRDISFKAACWIALVACLISLWIRSGIPLVAAPVAYHDDAFFARTANYLLAGQWLGPYDKMTLAKGMFYPLFVAIASFVSVPLKTAEQLAYLAASGVIALVVTRATQRRWLGLLIFLGLAFNPSFWNHWFAHISRESLYTALSLGLFGVIVLISFPELHRSKHSIVLGVSFGVLWTSFWLTREESIWLLPVSLFPVVTGIMNRVVIWRRNAEFSNRNGKLVQQLMPVLGPLALGVIIFLVGVGLVAGLNWRYYGVFRTNEFRSGGYVRAFGALARIEAAPFRRYVPVPQQARLKAYEVSDAARQISPYLEGDQGRPWAVYGCWIHPIAGPCDLQAGWIIWALRDSAEKAGHYRSGSETDAFYSTLADEINQACDKGRIRCSVRRDTFTPRFRWEYLGESVASSKELIKLVFDMGNGEVGPTPSVGSPKGLANFADLTNQQVSPAVDGVVQDLPLGQVSGWVAGRSSMPVLEVTPYTKREVKSSIITAPAPDVVAAHPDLKSVRFTLESNCPVMECDLEIHASIGNVAVPFQKLERGAPIDTPNLILFIDRATADDETWPIGEHRRAVQMRIAHRIGKLYAKSSRILTVLATIGLFVAIGRFHYRRPSLPLLVVAIGSIGAVASRLVLLSYVAATSFDTHFLHYCSSACPFLIVYIGAGMYLGYSSFLAPESVIEENPSILLDR